MQKQQVAGCAVLLFAAAAGMALGGPRRAEQTRIYEEQAAYRQLLAQTPVAPLTGEAASPDGRFTVRTVGKSDVYVSGVVAPESLQIVDAGGKVLWEDRGWLRQSVLWSPDSYYAAMVTAARTYHAVTVIETENFTDWDAVLPDGSAIPEYTFLPEENWGWWIGENALQLKVGDGDGEERHIYRCYPRIETDRDGSHLTGSTLEEERETLPGNWDFDRDGAPDTVELMTLWAEESGKQIPAWYELQIKAADGETLWSQEFSERSLREFERRQTDCQTD